MSTKDLFPQYTLHDPSFSVLRSWWKHLEEDKGERSRLRRANTLMEIMLCPAFHTLLHQLEQVRQENIHSHRYPKLAIIVGLVSRIKEESQESLGEQMGRSHTSSSRADVSPLRMRRLLACDGKDSDMEELYIVLRRMLALMGNRVHLGHLAATIWHWTLMDEKNPHDPRRRVACDYYAQIKSK